MFTEQMRGKKALKKHEQIRSSTDNTDHGWFNRRNDEAHNDVYSVCGYWLQKRTAMAKAAQNETFSV